MQGAAVNGNRYPDNDAALLRQRLAELHGLQPDQLLIAAGLTDFLGILCRCVLAPGSNAVTSERSFIVYSLATRSTGAQLLEVPMVNHAFDLDAVAAAVNNTTKLIFLANPNNPTGTAFDAVALEEFLDRIPDSVSVVIDEAYFDYAAHFAERRNFVYSRSVDYVRQQRNVLVLRTFSKAHGLAGLRVAYAIGDPRLLTPLARARATFSISSVAQAGAIAALDDPDHLLRALENNALGVDQLTRGLEKLGYRVPQPWGNFIYCELGEDARAFAKKMESEGIRIRHLAAWGAPTAIRISIGTPEENSAFLSAFDRVRATRR